MNKIGVAAECWRYLRIRKKYWLAPILFMLLLLGFIVVWGQSSVWTPLIYPLF